MIKKIRTIRNLAVFQNFEWDNSVINNNGQIMRFDRMNILYGRNYAGKTTLSRIVRAMEIGEISEKYDSPSFSVIFDDDTTINQDQIANVQKNIRVFNEDFVRENLRFIIDPEDNVKPFAVLGDDNNTLEEEIAVLRNEIGSNEENKETGLYEQLKNYKTIYIEVKSANDQLASSLDRQLSEKATGRNTGIKYRSNKFGDQNYNISKLKTDIEKVLSESYNSLVDHQKAEHELMLKEQVKSIVPALPTLSLQWEKFCIEAEELLSQEIGSSDKISELLREVSLNEWVKKGYDLHKDKREMCAFCGEKVSDERWSVLHKHFDDESRALEQRIGKLIEKIEMEMQAVENGFVTDKGLFYSNFHKEIEKLSESYSEFSSRYNGQLKLLKEQLSKRKEAITVSIPFVRPFDCSQEQRMILESYEEWRIQSNDFTGNLASEQTNAREALRLQEVYDFCQMTNYSEYMGFISENKKKVEDAKQALDLTQTEIERLEELITNKKRQLNDEEKGALLVNKYLTDFFGHEFLSLKAIEDINDGEKKVRFEIVRNGRRAYHLSEGECSLISFCYFVAKLNDIDTSGLKPIIWIDDPISSLDGNHIFFVYSLIAAEIAGKGAFEQLFVSTHNLDFLKYLRRLNSLEQQPNGKSKSCSKQYFIINRQGHYSTLLLMPKYLKEFGTEFNYLFSCIHQCSCIDTVDDSNFHLFYNFGNNARKFLEIYLYFKYPDFSEDKLERFFGEDKIPSILIDRINNEYSHLQGSIERAAMPVEVPEMVSTARLIIDKVKEDAEQYTALMKSIGIDS
ncbi:AAA family ATPase [Paenibacillus xylanexedens]|uniref:AAA family ATPase n=1 Tax=Paenibacillus xylanexedens TaxID=528191 RepID=UPI0011A916FB|nr:AAA family ATPase [Paenibacillus xylanexedens]